MTKPCKAVEERQPLRRMKVFILRYLNSILAAIDQNAGVLRLLINLSRKLFSCNRIAFSQPLLQFHSQQKKTIVQRSIVFPHMWASINRETRFSKKANMTGAHCMLSKMVSKLVSQKYVRGWYMVKLDNLRGDVCAFKHKVINAILPVCTYGLFTPTFTV